MKRNENYIERRVMTMERKNVKKKKTKIQMENKFKKEIKDGKV